MNGIMGMLQLALMNDIDDETKECLEIAQRSANSLLQTINYILDYSKIEVGKMKLIENEFNLKSMINEIVKLFSFDVKEKNLKLNVYMGKDVPESLYGDSIRLRQVLMNLINNAIKFTETGSIDLKIKSLEINSQNCNIEFKVIDTGVGIPKDKIKFLFKPFSQIDNSNTRKYQGTGLGLAISKKFINMMKGDIYVESEEGKGSIFSFKVNFKLEGI
jgi:signal transduction histidine kinase